MINAILKGIFALVVNLVNLLLVPIDNLIATALPSLSNGLNKVSAFFNWATGFIPWGVSWLGLDTEVITLLVGYYVFILTVPLVVAVIKLAIKWYDKLKP